MSDRDTALTDAARRAQDAKRLKNDPALAHFLEALKTRVVGRLAETPVTGEHATMNQQKLVMLLQMASQFESLLDAYMASGEIAEEMLRPKNLMNRRGL